MFLLRVHKSPITQGVFRPVSFIALCLLCSTTLTSCATVRAFPNFDYGGKTHTQFLQRAIERSTPSNARLLAELFGGLELGLDLGADGAQAIISVGGAATRCQHQSPCFDMTCNLCYDPLLRIHGICGGASYFTCRGTLPSACLPYTCTTRGINSRSGRTLEKTVLVKKFPRFEDPFCLGKQEKARSLRLENANSFSENSTSRQDLLGRDPRTSVKPFADPNTPNWVLSVPDSVTPCQGYDMCLDLRCGSCYDPYLGAHTSCGKLTYYDCNVNLPRECQPMRCTETNIHEIFPNENSAGNASPIQLNERTPQNDFGQNLRVKRQIGNQDQSGIDEEETLSPLMVRNFPPLVEEKQNCM